MRTGKIRAPFFVSAPCRRTRGWKRGTGKKGHPGVQGVGGKKRGKKEKKHTAHCHPVSARVGKKGRNTPEERPRTLPEASSHLPNRGVRKGGEKGENTPKSDISNGLGRGPGRKWCKDKGNSFSERKGVQDSWNKGKKLLNLPGDKCRRRKRSCGKGGAKKDRTCPRTGICLMRRCREGGRPKSMDGSGKRQR